MPSHATIDELFAAFAALSDADLLALRKAASMRLPGTQFSEPMDLIHEALTRCLDGRRHWPKSVPFPVFLANAMKSIASADRNAHSVKMVIQASSLESDAWEDPLGSLGLTAPSAEEDCIALENDRLAEANARNLLLAFESDKAAGSVIAGWLDGLSAKEVMAKSSISPKEYDAARKRVERRIAAMSPKRRPPP